MLKVNLESSSPRLRNRLTYSNCLTSITQRDLNSDLYNIAMRAHAVSGWNNGQTIWMVYGFFIGLAILKVNFNLFEG